MGSCSVAKREKLAYRCQMPGQPGAVEIDLDLIDQLCAAVMTGYSQVPKRGAEVGGLLLGRVEPEGPRSTRVLAFVPVSIEYRKGPSYRLSEEDRTQLASQVRAVRREPADGLQIVGLYRSHTRQEFGLTDEDIAVFDEHCPAPGSLFLLIRPSATRVPEAGVIARLNGQLSGRIPEQMFPFRRKVLESSEHLVCLSSPVGYALDVPDQAKQVDLPFAEATAHELISPDPLQRALATRKPEIAVRTPWVHSRPPRELVPLAGDETAPLRGSHLLLDGELSIGPDVAFPLLERGDAWQQARASSLAALDHAALARERRQKWLAGSLVALLFLIAGAIGGMELTSHAAGAARVAKPVYYEFGLQADRQPQGVAVTWDGRAPAMRDATSGLLLIQDGQTETRVPLSAQELERGSVLYRNRTSEMRFRLEVPQGQHSTLIESVELHAGPSAP